jgi:uncharacterized protein YkwD
MQLKSVVLGALLGGALVWAITSGVVSVDPSAAPGGFGGNSTDSENSTSNSSWVDLVGSALAPDELNDTRVERLVWRYTNVERNERGLRNVSYAPRIAEVADDHSANMARHDYIGHTEPNGQTGEERYAGVCDYSGKNYLFGENVGGAWYKEQMQAYGTDDTIYLENESEVARYLVDAWMRSDGHRENMLDAGWTELGVGVNVTDDKVYASQTFC